MAFAGIIYSILLQKKELALQREELRETRKEFAQQNFETTFFNLLKNQQEITNRIKGDFFWLSDTTRTTTHTSMGLDFFLRSKQEIRKIRSALLFKHFGVWDYLSYLEMPPEMDYPGEENVILNTARHEYTNYIYHITQTDWEAVKSYDHHDFCRLSYAYFFRRYHAIIGHYFRHLYHIFKFLYQAEMSDLQHTDIPHEQVTIQRKYHSYAQFVQAQMSAPELLLLYYNCLAFPRMKKLLIKYRILEKLAKEDFIDPKDEVIAGVKHKSRTSMFDFTNL